MQIRYVLLCDFSSDTNDGKLNLIGITDAVFAYQFPAMHKQCHLLVSMIPEASEYGKTIEAGFDLIDADGNALVSMKGPISIPNRKVILNHRHVIHDLQFPQAGTYEFVVKVDGKQVATHPVEAVLAQKA